MTTRTVKWFDATKGFRFIEAGTGGPDVFVHISAVGQAGMSGLNEGQKISYEVLADRAARASPRPAISRPSKARCCILTPTTDVLGGDLTD